MFLHFSYWEGRGGVWLERICDLTTKIRMIGKTKGGIHFLQGLLSEKRAMLSGLA